MNHRNVARSGPMLFALGSLLLGPGAAKAQNPAAADSVELTLECMVEYALNSSYRVRHLNLDIKQTRLRLEASRARLKSNVDLDFTLPAINAISQTRWSSDLQRNVIERENSRLLEAELSIRQPVILFGYPTNGYLSLNNDVYRLYQKEDDASDVQYYNRYFISYTQPLFQANELKNDLEEAQLALEGQELDFYEDVAEIVDNTAEEYHELFEIAYEQRIREAYVGRLEDALEVARIAAAADPDRSIDVDQIRVELANARQDLAASESRFRLEAASLKTEFDIPQDVALGLDPEIELARVSIDAERAIRYALELTPRIRQLDISQREAEIDLDNAKGEGGFELDVSVSYGREMQDEVFGRIWDEPENAYTVDVEGSVPIWDWGARDAMIQAQEIDVQQSVLRMEEARADITTDVRNEIRNVAEYEDRAFDMQANLTLARAVASTSLERYADGSISALDLLQSLDREVETGENFLEAYLGWRQALQRIREMTYYDFEHDMRLLDRFGISFEEGIGDVGG
ncbi:MAG: TolC family protein [Longimicrobiales bacterium]